MVVTYLILGLLVLSSNSMILADSTDENGACDALYNDVFQLIDYDCCITERFPEDENKTSKCQISEDENKLCDFYKCIIEDINMLIDDKIDDGKINDFLDQWEKDYPKEKAILIRLRRECLNGKYLEYINKNNNCLEARLYYCLHINTFMECQSWKNSDRCTKVKEHAQNCRMRMA